jgi:N-acetylglucosaminyl-diphospho-decaprenol L-rhamnosyltransferase
MISLLLVNYRSAALAAEAIRSARESARDALEVVVVDNSCDSREADALRAHADVVIASATNRGYAGGINDGRGACHGDVLLVSNPDIVFAPGAIDHLAAALDGGAAVAGPALYWDAAHEWLLPPSELHTALQKIDMVLASRSKRWFLERDRRRIRARMRFAALAGPTDFPALSGAVMAIRASAFDEADGFDERFRLYFEETDFLRRLAMSRKRIVYVPQARCRHLYNQSAGEAGGEAPALYAQSEVRYLEKWNGPFVARLLKRLERPQRTFDSVRLEGPLPVDPDRAIVEASPLPSFDTAAIHLPRSAHADIPTEVWAAYRSAILYLRVVDRESARAGAVYARYKG